MFLDIWEGGGRLRLYATRRLDAEASRPGSKRRHGGRARTQGSQATGTVLCPRRAAVSVHAETNASNSLFHGGTLLMSSSG